MFLELVINTLYGDQPSRLKRTNLGKRLAQLWDEGIDRQPTLSKYQIALALAGKPPFRVSAEPYQSVKCLIDLRNALAHPKSTFGSHAEDRLEHVLRGRYKFREQTSGHTFFPYACLTPYCALWALKSAATFVIDFYKALPPASRDTIMDVGRLRDWRQRAEQLAGKGGQS